METLNGYHVIAEKVSPVNKERRIILAVSKRPHGFSYVVANLPLAEYAPREWYCGEYAVSIEDAMTFYRRRRY